MEYYHKEYGRVTKAQVDEIGCSLK